MIDYPGFLIGRVVAVSPPLLVESALCVLSAGAVVGAGAGAAVESLAGSVFFSSLLQLVKAIANSRAVPSNANFDFLRSIVFGLEYNVTEIIQDAEILFQQ